jgi:hypothetical protein
MINLLKTTSMPYQTIRTNGKNNSTNVKNALLKEATADKNQESASFLFFAANSDGERLNFALNARAK